jgi:hypothetical protein
MSYYSDTDSYSQAGSWLLGTARRNPEALLLLAAGCCLLMRSGSSASRIASRTRYDETGPDYQAGSSRASADRASSKVREGMSRAADTATGYAAQIKDQVSDTAGSYAETVSEFAQDARRNVSEHSARLSRQAQSTLQSSMNRVLREQPLAVVMAGLAAGAAVAAVLPSTELEDRAFGSAGESLRQAAGQAAERVKDAAGKAGEHLKTAAEERGLTSEGLRELAGEVGDTFTSAVSGKSYDQPGATVAPKSPASPTNLSQSFGTGRSSGAGQNFGTSQAGREPNRSSEMARPDTEPRQDKP